MAHHPERVRPGGDPRADRRRPGRRGPAAAPAARPRGGQWPVVLAGRAAAVAPVPVPRSLAVVAEPGAAAGPGRRRAPGRGRGPAGAAVLHVRRRWPGCRGGRGTVGQGDRRLGGARPVHPAPDRRRARWPARARRLRTGRPPRARPGPPRRPVRQYRHPLAPGHQRGRAGPPARPRADPRGRPRHRPDAAAVATARPPSAAGAAVGPGRARVEPGLDAARAVRPALVRRDGLRPASPAGRLSLRPATGRAHRRAVDCLPARQSRAAAGYLQILLDGWKSGVCPVALLAVVLLAARTQPDSGVPAQQDGAVV